MFKILDLVTCEYIKDYSGYEGTDSDMTFNDIEHALNFLCYNTCRWSGNRKIYEFEVIKVDDNV